MKKYLITSLIIFGLWYISIMIAKIIFGGQTIVPSYIAMLFLAILINTVIALIVFVVAIYKDKL